MSGDYDGILLGGGAQRTRARSALGAEGGFMRPVRTASGNGRRDPKRNQERILKAATEEFARFGLGGARVDRIAARAGANKRMLYYYYGNKEALFLAAMHSPLVATIGEVLQRCAGAGTFRRGVDPVQLYISIAGLGYFYLSNRHTLSTIFRRPLLAPRQKAARLRHMIELVLGYLRK